MARMRGKFFYVTCFISSALLAMFLLSIGTAIATFDDIWRVQGRIESTKTEFFIGHFAGGMRNNFIRDGADPDAWYVKRLTDIDQWAYQRAIAKIPEDNFERLFWHFRSNFLPKFYLPEKQRNLILDDLIVDAVTQLHAIDHYNITAHIDQDTEQYKMMDVYSGISIDYANQFPTHINTQSLTLALEKICYSAKTIDPEKIKPYGLTSDINSLLWILSNAYLRTSLPNWYADGQCNQMVATCWLQISDRIPAILLKDQALVAYYTGTESPPSVKKRYQDFIQYYQKQDAALRQRARTACHPDTVK